MNLPRRLSVRIGLSIVAIECVALAAIGFYYMRAFSQQIDREYLTRLQTPARVITLNLWNVNTAMDAGLLRQVVGDEFIEALLIQADGIVAMATRPSLIGQSLSELTDFPPIKLSEVGPTGLVLNDTQGNEARTVTVNPWVTGGGQTASYYFLVSARSTRSAAAKAAVARQFFWGSMITVVVTSLAIIILLHRQVTRRIAATLESLGKVESGDYSTRLELPRTTDEFQQLARGVNAMTGQLQRSFEKLTAKVRELDVARQEVQHQSHFLDKLLVNLPVAVFVKNVPRGFRVEYWNRKAEELFGSQSSEVLGKDDFEISPRQAELYREKDLECIRTRTAVDVPEEAFDRRDGCRVLLRTIKVPLYDEKGQPTYILGIAEDITARRQIEIENRKSRDFLQLVLDSIPVRVFWKDVGLKYRGCNRLFARDAGLDQPERLDGLTDFDLAWGKAEAQRYREDDTAVMQSGVSRVDFEEPQTRPDGKVGWLQTSKVPLHSSEGQVVGVLGCYQDISLRKSAQEALRASEERYRALSESAIVGIAVHQDDVLKYANLALARMLGSQEPAELLGRNVWQHYIEAAWAPELRERIQLARSGKKQEPHPGWPMIRKDGSRVWVETTTTPILWEGRQAMLVFVQDTTEARAMQAEKQRSLAILETTTDLIGRSDAQGNTLYINRAGRAMLGLGPDEDLKGTHIASFHPPEVAERLFREAIPSAERDGYWSGETTIRTRGDQEIPVSQVILAHRDASGKIDCHSTIIRDISRLKEAEVELRHLNTDLEERVQKRTVELQRLVNAMSGREVRMAELKKMLSILQDRLRAAGLDPSLPGLRTQNPQGG